MAEIRYSTQFRIIADAALRKHCIHIICLSGEGGFAFNGRKLCIKADDAAIIVRPDLVTDVWQTDDLSVEIITAPAEYLNNLLPESNYGIGGSISLFNNPIIPLTKENAGKLTADIRNIRMRMEDKGHLFHEGLMGSLMLTMIYDLFAFHAENHTPIYATDRSMYVVKSLMSLFEGGSCKRHRDVAHYAAELNVTPKYLSDTVRRQTGQSVTYYIDRHTVPIIKKYLSDPTMSVTQIADEMNFKSVSYFSRYVSRHLGVSPREYRMSKMVK